MIRKMPMRFMPIHCSRTCPQYKNKQVYALGTETFRPDYYSAMQVLERLKALF